jgi:hypothetical protein
MAESFPQRSHSSRATIVSRVSGPPLDGGESEGNLTGYTGRVDCERLSPLSAREWIFLVVSFRCAEFMAENILQPLRRSVCCFY